jgi:hypothetical protein
MRALVGLNGFAEPPRHTTGANGHGVAVRFSFELNNVLAQECTIIEQSLYLSRIWPAHDYDAPRHRLWHFVPFEATERM